MGFQGHYYDGEEADKIRSFTIKTVRQEIAQVLIAANKTEIPVHRNASTASNSYQKGLAFVVVVPRPTNQYPEKVLDSGGKAHSGECNEWTLLIQSSSGKQGGTTTGDSQTTSDDDLMDILRRGLSERYVRFRDDLGFYGLKVIALDESKEGKGMLNPLQMTFRNYVRMDSDQVLT